MIEAKYDVPDMSCAHCKSAIEDSLNGLSGVEKATADPDSKVVEVAYDKNQVEEERIKSAIEDAGYTVAT
ncbi:MAG: cation transporter [Actinomycetota bacterium]|nr:cation transporter [Actinomycetota bacterium]HZY64281.1 cation transporter [Rubrobacteraceae bacterium]